VSPGVYIVRADICDACPTPCARQTDPSHYGDPCVACPATPPRWGAFGKCAPGTRPVQILAKPASLRGLGDLVAVVADPIGRALRLNKSKCGCRSRQEWLNRAVPFARQDSAP
jgi:hypothetical protein